MISAIIPEIRWDFNFDLVLILIFTSYIIYGFLSGGHKQIRLSINLILPFVIIYYMGKNITKYLYLPLTRSFFFELLEEFLPIAKNLFGMIFAYLLTYVLLFVGIFILSIFARKYLLNENMRAKLGKYNNYLGVLFAVINGYVLVYFIILPAFSFNLVGTDAHLTNFVLENPPPFSRIARTAEKAVPIKGLADKASNFQELLSVDGIEGYYNEAIYDYQQLYVGGSESYEKEFMTVVYPELTQEAKVILDSAYFAYFNDNLAPGSYYGVSLVLLQEGTSGNNIYQDMLEAESEFRSTFSDNEDIASAHIKAIAQYDDNVLYYAYQVEVEAYEALLASYMSDATIYQTQKVEALINGTTFTDTFTQVRPVLDAEKPSGYAPLEASDLPLVDPEVGIDPTITAAILYVEQYEDKINVSTELKDLGKNFANHQGLLEWFIDDLSGGTNVDPGLTDISAVIVSFKTNYEDINASLNDDELENKLYLAMMSIQSYDVFTLWLEHTMNNIDTVLLEDIPLESSRCPSFNTSEVTTYDFTDDALSLVSTLFQGESVSWIITQFKYDYESGIFDDVFADYDEVTEVLVSTKDLVDEYELKYKDIANSIDGNISMLIKIGISVMKYHLDVYDTLKNTPLLAAAFNDAARFCPSTYDVPGYDDVEICQKSEGEGGMFGEFLNMRYLVSEIYFKAYFMVDDDNERKTYDTEAMHEYLLMVNDSVEDNVITKEVVSAIGDQFAFNVIDESNGLTLLEQMYNEGYITIEAMRVLADDEYELFSFEFRSKVRSLIR